jgi:plasmid maintenance system antidote protein VapI
MTNLDTIAEVWEALRMHIDLNERKEAAETLVNYLMENNYEASEIKEEFR